MCKAALEASRTLFKTQAMLRVHMQPNVPYTASAYETIFLRQRSCTLLATSPSQSLQTVRLLREQLRAEVCMNLDQLKTMFHIRRVPPNQPQLFLFWNLRTYTAAFDVVI